MGVRDVLCTRGVCFWGKQQVDVEFMTKLIFHNVNFVINSTSACCFPQKHTPLVQRTSLTPIISLDPRRLRLEHYYLLDAITLCTELVDCLSNMLTTYYELWANDGAGLEVSVGANDGEVLRVIRVRDQHDP